MPATPMQKRTWSTAPIPGEAARRLAEEAGVSEIVARVLLARGVGDAEAAHRFLTPDLDRDWREPSTVPGMDAAAETVAAAVSRGAAIVVFGDFDADGVTAAALLTAGLRRLGAAAEPVLPHRLNDGYGLGDTSVERLIAMRPELVVTVDCGISSGAEVERLAAAGIGVVVTDHHEPAEGVPARIPVTDPKLGGAPFEGLAGAGVALKLLQAVGTLMGSPDVWLDFADLAALGTIADVVPLLDENRALVAYGLERMRRDPRPGVAALAGVAGVEPSALDAGRVAFALAPRINAAGRMADPAEALELLLTEDPARAARLATSLDAHNRARQAQEAELVTAGREMAASTFAAGDRALVLAGEGWHEGVKGIAAGRLAGEYGVPTLMFCIRDGVAHGSGRSAAGVDLHAAVASCADVLTRFGGHAAAVGVTLPAESLPVFERRLRSELEGLPAEAFVPAFEIDAELHLSDVSRELAGELAALEPFGHGNPRPVLGARGVFVGGARQIGSDGAHLRFDAYDGLASVPAVYFRCPEPGAVASTTSAVDLAFNVELDSWRGRERLQLLVRDIASHDAPDDAPAASLVEELFADAERILARGAYEGIADADAFHTKLAGVTFEGRQDVIARLTPGSLLRVERQPDNEHDPNACAVFDARGDQAGFFNRRLAAELAPAIDGGTAYDVTVTEVTGGGDGESLGVNVLVERRGAEADGSEAAMGVERRAELARLSPDALDAALARHLIGDRALHDAQQRSLAHLAAGRSCLTVMATGRGKSLVFHLHAARTAIAKGQASVFVYPLRALVADQSFNITSKLAAVGVTVGVLTGESAPSARDEAFAALGAGELDVVMTTPEFLERHAERFAASGRVGFLVVDEAHHVGLAKAGHRPAYARLGEAARTLGDPVVLACTATAGDDVAAIVRDSLGIAETVLDPTVRDNLRIADRRGAPDKLTHVASLAARGEKVIIYVNSREQSVRIAQRLRDASPALLHRVAFYNGGMARAARHAVEGALRDGDLTAVVATSAFGEGVDIPDVRHVVLVHVPFDRVEFNQMCGRCGRDGDAATVHLLFGAKDAAVNELILEACAPDLDDLRTLYAVLRERAATSPDGWVEVTNAELAADVKRRRARARLSDKGASAGIGIFRELGFVTGEGLGNYRRLRLEAPPEAKTDLTTSVRYAEGLEEAAEFAQFRDWVLAAPAPDLLATFNRPILPST